MRVVVEGGSIAGASRIAVAAAGLAQRGHRIYWRGEVPAGLARPGVQPASWRSLPATRAEVVVGGGTPMAVARCGWLAGAEAMVIDARRDEVARWGAAQRFGWQTLYGLALAHEDEAMDLTQGPRGLDHERIGLWPTGPPAPAPDPAHADTEVLERACERALARHRCRSPRAAVFVDRDGTLIRETGYLSDPDQVELLPGVGRALRAIQDSGHPVVVVSNQSGIERGLYPAAAAYATMARLRERLREDGVELTAVYLCPHRPETGCACRKPRPGLLLRAAEDLVLSLRHSVMIGDKAIDVVAAHRAGGLGVLVRSGYGTGEERAWPADTRRPDAVADDLAGAAEWFLARE